MRIFSSAAAAAMLVLLACHDQPAGPDEAVLTFSADSLDFGEVEAGHPAKPVELTVTNNGSHPTGLLRAGFNNLTGEFILSQDLCSGRTLAAGDSCKIYVTLRSSGGGIARSVLIVADSPGDSASAVLQGVVVVRRIFVTNESVGNFGHADVGTVPPPRTFVLENQGTVVTAPLTVFLNSDSAEVGDFPEFHVTQDLCSGRILYPQDVCTVTVEFRPQIPGSKEWNLWFLGAPSEVFVAGLTGDS